MTDGTWLLMLGAAVVVTFLVVSIAGIVARGHGKAPAHPPADQGPDVFRVEERLLRWLNARRREVAADPLGTVPGLEEIARHAAFVRAGGAVQGAPAGEDLEALRARLHPRLVGPIAWILGEPQRTGPDPDQAATRLAGQLDLGEVGTDPHWTRVGVGVARGPEGVVACLVFARRLALLDGEPPRQGFVIEPLILTGATREGAFSGLRLTLRTPMGSPRPVPVERGDEGRFRAVLEFRDGPGRWTLEWRGAEGPAAIMPIDVVG